MSLIAGSFIVVMIFSTGVIVGRMLRLRVIEDELTRLQNNYDTLIAEVNDLNREDGRYGLPPY